MTPRVTVTLSPHWGQGAVLGVVEGAMLVGVVVVGDVAVVGDVVAVEAVEVAEVVGVVGAVVGNH